MTRLSDIALTALAPLIWGSTYIVTVTYLPGLDPLLVSLLRALPAGLLLLLVTRQLPTGIWWPRVVLLGALNFSFFWWMLFIAAYSLPGGVAATVGAIQPLVVVFLARLFVGTPIMSVSIVAAVGGALGVGLLILKPGAELDATGIMAGLLGALSMALGTVLTRRWQPPVPLLTFTSWQLTAGGILLLPALFGNLQALAGFTADNLIGIAYLGLIGAGLTYVLWFRGIARLNPNLVAQLGFLSPVTAVALGWLFRDETLSLLQWMGIALIFGSILLGQRGMRRGR
ncbi:EamA family transporter [Pleomorphomonas diazotrophica]|uniref:EamA family transporter n=1 Tax=Pleomorphomonas diazotrophica TaxID=1166257 RepID=A0A1I4VZK2_9HYPH|nr:EamA family transporter [Pleomorphomonas diazotrophica]PKR88261.1 EamA family transporter [Pleomorphomonas diazotrophica]SFN06575.1 probable blue pigment (indigoidine) exporter [Pleomorphomonas diazotrophica]